MADRQVTQTFRCPLEGSNLVRMSVKTRSGFTLIETLIVVTILAILASVVLPAAQTNETQTLEATARSLTADLRYARALAIQYNTELTVTFDVPGNAYELAHTGSGPSPPLRNPLDPAKQTNEPFRVTITPRGTATFGNSPTRLFAVHLNDSSKTTTQVTFGPLGGTGPARNEDTLIWLAKGSGPETRYVRVTISWVTGLVWLGPPEAFPGTLRPVSASVAG